jgi:hypothetical protein
MIFRKKVQPIGLQLKKDVHRYLIAVNIQLIP